MTALPGGTVQAMPVDTTRGQGEAGLLARETSDWGPAPSMSALEVEPEAHGAVDGGAERRVGEGAERSAGPPASDAPQSTTAGRAGCGRRRRGTGGLRR